MLATEAAAQSTNFEGQTGGIVAPFGAASVTVGGRLQLGADFVQQPREIGGVDDSAQPTTIAYYGRVYPVDRLAIQVAVLRLAGEIAPGFDAMGDGRLMLGAAFRF
jgi:hypothetical protein